MAKKLGAGLLSEPIAGRSEDEVVTEEQEVFCVEFIKTGSAGKAYRAAKPDRDTNSATGSGYWIRLPHIRRRIYELQEEMKERSMVTLETHLQELADLRDDAKDAGKYSAAISAEIARGKAAGLYVQKQEVSVGALENMSSDQLMKKLEEMQRNQGDSRMLEHQGEVQDAEYTESE